MYVLVCRHKGNGWLNESIKKQNAVIIIIIIILLLLFWICDLLVKQVQCDDCSVMKHECSVMKHELNVLLAIYIHQSDEGAI